MNMAMNTLPPLKGNYCARIPEDPYKCRIARDAPLVFDNRKPFLAHGREPASRPIGFREDKR